MSQIEEQTIDNIDGFNNFNKDRCNPQPISLMNPHPVKLQEVDIFPGPHSYIHSSSNVSPKHQSVINGKNAPKATCGEDIQNGEDIISNQSHGIVDDKKNDKDSPGKSGY